MRTYVLEVTVQEINGGRKETSRRIVKVSDDVETTEDAARTALDRAVRDLTGNRRAYATYQRESCYKDGPHEFSGMIYIMLERNKREKRLCYTNVLTQAKYDVYVTAVPD